MKICASPWQAAIPFPFKTSKFDWTPDDIRIGKISRFLEKRGSRFKFDSRSFNYSMSKEESSGVIGERNSIWSTEMKYHFNQIFSLLIK